MPGFADKPANHGYDGGEASDHPEQEPQEPHVGELEGLRLSHRDFGILWFSAEGGIDL